MEAWIYARSTEPLTRSALVEFIEACRLDPASSRWLFENDAGRAPMVFEQWTDEASVKKAVEELFFILDVSRPTKARDRIRELLSETVRLFRIAFDDNALTADIQTALPTIAAFVAKSTDGVVRYPEKGRSDVFLDANSKRIYRL